MNGIITIPNLLTFLRMALIPVFASLLFYGYYGWALFVFFFAGVSDGVDGFVARRYNQQSELGTILDPIADKLLMTTAFVIVALPHVLPADNKHFPVAFWVSAAVIGRDVLIIAVALAIFIITDFRGFQAFKFRQSLDCRADFRHRNNFIRRRRAAIQRLLSADDLFYRRALRRSFWLSLHLPRRQIDEREKRCRAVKHFKFHRRCLFD